MLKELVAECSDFDYKKEVETKRPRSWLKTVSAFANGIGGSLFFGVDDDGAISGLDDISFASDKVSELIKTRIEPTPRSLRCPIK